MTSRYLIVVGVDGSDGGSRGLEWAATEAATRGGAVQAVIAWSWDGRDYGPIAATTAEQEKQRAARLLQREVQELTARLGSAFPVATEVTRAGRPTCWLPPARPPTCWCWAATGTAGCGTPCSAR